MRICNIPNLIKALTHSCPNRAWITSILLFCLIATLSSSAQTFTSLFSFDFSDGAQPYLAPLTQGHDGDLYGTTSEGGASNGTIFKISPNGSESVVHNFDASVDGGFPTAALTLATDGNFYGTTLEGGGAPGNGGTVFKLAPDSTLTTLHAFCSDPFTNCPDGGFPDATVIQGRDGNFYGTTQIGGTAATTSGTVFRITPRGKLTTLYSFCAPTCSDGGFPNASLIQASDGNFYGTTPSTIFKMTPMGKLTTLHTMGKNDGSGIVAPLIQANDGNFYGTASEGFTDVGTVFKITPKGEFAVLHTFHISDGSMPKGGLIQASDGNLYGTTFEGGTKTWGIVFKITLGGDFSTIYNFCSQTNCVDGTEPASGLLQATNGVLYGTTSSGGQNNGGTVFSITAGLPAFVSLIPMRAKVGTTIQILGQGFNSATRVSFNGAAANHTVISDTYLTAVVPNNGTIGDVSVSTNSGTLSSTAKFDVLPIETGFTPASGVVGTEVTIKGGGFLGTNKVTFGGVKAAFTIVSGSEVTATVPVGARTGKITVTTAGGSAAEGTFTVE